MNLHLENVNLESKSGPNHFASKLMKYLNIDIDVNKKPDAILCFIESHRRDLTKIPLIQRLDGIYFNKMQDFKSLNTNIKRTYDSARGVIFQSHFNKKLTTRYFGAHENSTIIHNGADVDYIDKIQALKNNRLDKFENVWSCASSWRPHKRLRSNIRYFLEHSSDKDCLIIAGKTDEAIPKNDRIFYVGDLKIEQLIALYKRSDYFIHLAWLDHCPNVVVDARACGNQIICSSAGGTREVAGLNAIVIQEDEWDFSPVELYNPPYLDFDKKVENSWDIDYNMYKIAENYKKYLKRFID